MNDPSQNISDAELQRQRESIRRGLHRANTAAVAILLVVIALALAAILLSQYSDRQRVRAEAAELAVRRRLYDSHLAQARAERLSDSMGRQTRALKAIEAAVALRPQLPDVDILPLRNEAIASIALSDIQAEGLFQRMPGENESFDVDFTLENFAVGHTNGEISVHRLSNGLESRRLSPPASTNSLEKFGGVADLIFAPRDETLAAIYQSGAVFLFPAQSNGPALRLDATAMRFGRPFQFSADGHWAVVLTISGTARIFDRENDGKLVTELPQRNLWALAFHPRTNWIALGQPALTHVVDFAGKPMLAPFTNFWTPEVLAFRADGRQLASGNGQIGLVLWNLQTREPLRLRAPTGNLYDFGYDESGDWFSAAVGDGISRIWDARTGELVHRLDNGRVVRFAQNGRRFAWIRPGEGFGICRMANDESFRQFRWQSDRDYHRRFWSVDFSEDGRWMAAVDNRYLVIWNVASERVLETIPGQRRLTVLWSSRHQGWITTGDEGVFVYPMTAGGDTNQPHLEKPRHIEVSVTRNFGQSALAPDGHTLGIVASPHTPLLIDLDAPEKRTRLHFAGAGSLGHLAFSPDGKLVVSSSGAPDSRALLVWETATGKLVREMPGAHSRAVFRNDGKQLVLGSAQQYRLWNPETWEPVLSNSLTRENLGGTTGAAGYSQDGGLLAIAPSRQLVQLVDPSTGREMASLAAPEPHPVSWLRFSPRGDQLAVATFDGAVQLWNLAALRGRLAAFGLDWQKNNSNSHRLTPLVGLGGTSSFAKFVAFPLLAVALALAFALFAFQRQRRLLAGYLQMDRLAFERARALDAAQGEVAHAQKMKALGTLAAGIAHDFNNLLSVIRMSNQLTAETVKENAEVAENVDEIEHAVQQGQKLVRSMLGYSREEIDESAPFALPELVEDTVALLSKQFLNGIALTLELDRDTPLARGSRSRMEQILLNLIVNSSEAMKGRGGLRIVVRKATASESSLVLRPRAAQTYGEIVVSDSGEGIDAEILPRIFEPFFTTKTRGTTRGTGLGLSTVYTMAEQDGLGLAVESGMGRGTTFRIVVPGNT